MNAPLGVKEIAILTVGASAFLILLFTAIGWRGNNSLETYVRDPAATFGFTPLAGMVSHIGVFALVATGVICIFASRHVRHGMGLLFWAGVFSLMIGIDDFFMFHEGLAPRIGLPEIAVFAFYGAFALTILVVFRASLIGASHVGLYAAVALLAASVLSDVSMAPSAPQIVIEDSLKFIGLIVWSYYWVRRANLAMSGAPMAEETRLAAPRATTRA